VLEISKEAFADAQDWLGGENLTQKDGVWIAEVTLPDDESLPKKIVAMGAGVKVLSPVSLQEKVQSFLSAVQKRYE
jgi:predicted DNA-binding transcriptional regulator YafY